MVLIQRLQLMFLLMALHVRVVWAAPLQAWGGDEGGSSDYPASQLDAGLEPLGHPGDPLNVSSVPTSSPIPVLQPESNLTPVPVGEGDAASQPASRSEAAGDGTDAVSGRSTSVSTPQKTTNVFFGVCHEDGRRRCMITTAALVVSLLFAALLCCGVVYWWRKRKQLLFAASGDQLGTRGYPGTAESSTRHQQMLPQPYFEPPHPPSPSPDIPQWVWSQPSTPPIQQPPRPQDPLGCPCSED